MFKQMLTETGDGGLLWLALFLLLLQALISAAIALLILPKNYRQNAVRTFLYLTLLSLAVPFGALLVSCFAMWLARRFPLPPDELRINAITLPDFSSELVANVRHGGGARLRSQLDNVRAPVNERLTALVAVQSMDKRRSSPILRSLLADSVEDIRLLVYGMLDGAEKGITQQIHAELPRLAAAQTQAERYGLNSQLANLYWELIYQNLVLDDIFDYTVRQVDMYATTALTINQHSAPLWYLRGRLALIRKDPMLARLYLQRALEHGFPNDRLLPQLAEAAYLNREFRQARELMAGMLNRSTLPSLQPVLSYWNL